MKKLLTLITAMAVITTCFAGCGSKTESGTATGQTHTDGNSQSVSVADASKADVNYENDKFIKKEYKNYFEYEIYTNHIEIIEWGGDFYIDGTELQIPAEIEGLPVTVLKAKSFNYCTHISKVVIPDSVIEIGNRAFDGCDKLSEVELPQSITKMGSDVFDKTPFFQAQSELIVNDIMLKCGQTEGDVIIPNGIRGIFGGAFDESSGITSITLPDTLTIVGDFAFDGCSQIKSMEIPNSVTSIGAAAFNCCSSLSSITIPESVTQIGRNAFKDCSSLKEITLPNKITEIGEEMFSNSGLTSITLPNGVTTIGDNAFYRCESLEFVQMSNGVISIGKHAFSDCFKLTSITIPETVTSIEEHAFDACHALTNIVIPDSVTTLGKDIFDQCSNPNMNITYKGNTYTPTTWEKAFD